MAKTGLIQDTRFQGHETGPGHPERPQRLARIAEVFRGRGLAGERGGPDAGRPGASSAGTAAGGGACVPLSFEPVDMALVRRNHDDAYIERLRKACDEGRPYIDVADSAICPESFEIARLAAGALVAAVDAVLAGEVDNAFCAVRPPGHHAERSVSMGFCLFNNVAVAARHLIDDHGLSRVLILDWDVHHGNGTQHAFESDRQVLFISLHGHPSIVYPGTGYAEERGRGEGHGYTINVPILPPGRDEVWRRAFDEIVIPAVEDYSPEFVLISAGFDAHRADPLAPLELETDAFGWMTDELVAMAGRHCGGKLVSVLEGGYDLEALAASAALHVERLLRA